MMIKPKGDYIDGRFVRSRHPVDEIPSVDPGDREGIIGDFPVSGDGVDLALDAARSALKSWSSKPHADRFAALQRLRAEIRNRSDDLLAIISRETGRPTWETREEVQQLHRGMDELLSGAQAELSLCRAPPGQSQVRFDPLGIVAVLSPFSQPALLLHLDVVAALIAGCTVVYKPSEHTPATGQVYAEIVDEAGLPRGVVNMVQGRADVGLALAAHPRADGVLFRGTAENGQRLRQELTCSPGKMVHTQCSGNAAALVLDDANPEQAAFQIIIGACTTAGQRCTSTHRVIVQKRIAPVLTDHMAHLLRDLKVGYATDSNTFMGPLISSGAMDDYNAEQVRIGGQGGAALVQGAPLSSRRRGFYVTPSLHRLAPRNMIALSEQEILGPTILLSTVDELEQGIQLVNDTPFGLVMSVFCRDDRSLSSVRRAQTAGLCLHNLPTTWWTDRLPLQARGLSGSGQPSGILTARLCTRLTTWIDDRGALDETMLPPGLPRHLH